MLTEERFKLILDILKEKKSITVNELVEELTYFRIYSKKRFNIFR